MNMPGMTTKTRLLLITIGLIVLAFVFYAGRRSASDDSQVKAAKEEVKAAEASAKYWENIAGIHFNKWKGAEDSVRWMTKDIDSLKKHRTINVIMVTSQPVIPYQAAQLDSIWKAVYPE